MYEFSSSPSHQWAIKPLIDWDMECWNYYIRHNISFPSKTLNCLNKYLIIWKIIILIFPYQLSPQFHSKVCNLGFFSRMVPAGDRFWYKIVRFMADSLTSGVSDGLREPGPAVLKQILKFSWSSWAFLKWSQILVPFLRQTVKASVTEDFNINAFFSLVWYKNASDMV